MLRVENLESREVPSVNQVGANLFINMDDPGYVSVQSGQVIENGVVTQTVGPIANVVVVGTNKRDVIEVNINTNATIFGGNGDDTIFGGTGTNNIFAGNGEDKVYALLGSNAIDGGNGKDMIFTNFPANVVNDNKDLVVRFFGPNRLPNSGFVGMEDGVLYITPPANGSSVTLLPVGKNGVKVVSSFAPTQTFFNVKAISYFGGSGNDTYTNFTDVKVEAVYGAAGDDVIVSGTGDFFLGKGSGGNDVIVARAKQNDVSTNPQVTSAAVSRDVVFILNGKNNVIRSGVNDLVFDFTGDTLYVPN